MTQPRNGALRQLRIIEKVLANVTIEDRLRPGQTTPCWIWHGPDSGNGRGGGYPRMKLDGQTVAVHRVVYTHFHGYIPGRKQIDHTCRNRRCVSPLHLEMVTHRQNMKRRDRAGRKDAGKDGSQEERKP